MHFFEILLFLGFVLVFAKARELTGDEAFSDEEPGMAVEGEAVLEDMNEEEDSKEYEFLKQDDEDIKPEESDSKRQSRSPRPSSVTVPILIPPYANGVTFRLCYCFRRRCYGN